MRNSVQFTQQKNCFSGPGLDRIDQGGPYPQTRTLFIMAVYWWI